MEDEGPGYHGQLTLGRVCRGVRLRLQKQKVPPPALHATHGLLSFRLAMTEGAGLGWIKGCAISTRSGAHRPLWGEGSERILKEEPTMLRLQSLLRAALVATSLVSTHAALAQAPAPEPLHHPSPDFCAQMRNARTPAERRALMQRMQDIHGLNESDRMSGRARGGMPGGTMNRRSWRAMYEEGCLNEDASAVRPVPHVQGGVAYVSGGVGQDSVDAMRGVAANYNLRLTFIDQGGAYVSDVDIRIRSADGAVSLAVVSEGPLFYAHLPRGQYQVSASYNGVVRQGTLVVPAHGAIVRTMTWPR
jgi:hypothetical protein